jgi:hypothetical protein
VRILRKSAVAILMAFVLALLGLIGGLGYHLNHLQELSFVRHQIAGYADATISFSATYNPLLLPFYWISRNGYVDRNFSLIYVPEGNGPGEFGGPMWGLGPKDHYDYYTIVMTTWGFWPNLLILLFATVFIEVARARALYIALLLGSLGFYVGLLFGMFAGLAVGVFFAWFTMFKLSRNNIAVKFWRSLWE